MQHRNCDLCGSATYTHLPQDPRIAVCSSCGFVFVPMRRSPAEIAASWGDIYLIGEYDPEWPAVKARLYYVAEWIDQNIGLAGKRLLDIGAGKGQFLREAEKRGAHVFGIEPALSEPVGHVIQHAIEDGPIVGLHDLIETFDVVTINWTLENCGDCLAMLRFAREHCKPDGWVVVATGSRLLVPFKKPLSKYLNPNVPADLHCFRWSANSLRMAAYKSGLMALHSNPYNETDWLVMAFQGSRNIMRPSLDGRGVVFNREPITTKPGPWNDEPKEILAHFAEWQRVAP